MLSYTLTTEGETEAVLHVANVTQGRPFCNVFVWRAYVNIRVLLLEARAGSMFKHWQGYLHGRRPVRTWFLEIDFVRVVFVCVCTCNNSI